MTGGGEGRGLSHERASHFFLPFHPSPNILMRLPIPPPSTPPLLNVVKGFLIPPHPPATPVLNVARDRPAPPVLSLSRDQPAPPGVIALTGLPP